jgi:hypothetical protein
MTANTLPRAPLYTAAHDLAVWLETHRLGREGQDLLAELCALARELLFRIGAALTFAGPRRLHLRLADEAAITRVVRGTSPGTSVGDMRA